MRGGGCRTAAGGGDVNGGAAGSGSGNQGGNKVVVTTIEELDIDHNSSTASLMVMDHHRHGSDHSLRGSSGGLRSSASTSTGLTVAVKNNPDLVPFIQQQQSKLLISSYLKVSKYQKQISKFSVEPKSERIFFLVFLP